MLASMGTVPLYGQILSDPRNLELLRRLPSLSGMKIPGMDDVERQMEDNQKLLSEAPLPNPQVEQLKEQIMMLDQQAQQAVHMNPAMAQQVIQQATQLRSGRFSSRCSNSRHSSRAFKCRRMRPRIMRSERKA